MAYTLNNGASMISNGGNANTSGGRFAFGGPSGGNTSVLVTGTPASTISGDIDLRTDNGNATCAFTVDPSATLNVPAIITTQVNSAGLTKAGAGLLTLSALNTYTGTTAVNARTLVLGSGASLATGSVSVGASGTLQNAGTINGPVSVTGMLTGSGGTVGAGLTVNVGGVVSLTSGSQTLRGAVTNFGTMRVTGGANLLTGNATSFVNNGLLDLLTAGTGTTLPANFTNGAGGVVLTRDALRIKNVSVARDVNDAVTGVAVVIDGYTGHTYSLQRAPTPSGADFHGVAGVAAQNGTTGAALNFTDPTPSATEPYYRVLLNP